MQRRKTDDIIAENVRRKKSLFEAYDPVKGIGSKVPRFRLNMDASGSKCLMLPKPMIQDEFIKKLTTYDHIYQYIFYDEEAQKYPGSPHDRFCEIFKIINDIRLDYDFEFWAISTNMIKDKEGSDDIPFRLNRPQRRYLAKLEEMRLDGVPIRIVLLKARQWGGSTLTQRYMAWIQLRHKNNWHSAIITDVEDQARHIRGMFTKLSDNYPRDVGSFELTPYEGSSKNRVIKDRGCIIGIGSAQEPDNLRSFDFSMVHMSEVGSWKSTPKRSAQDLAQAVKSAVAKMPHSLIVEESTAKGVGNYFHKEWIAANNNKGGYHPFFVPWFEIERYTLEIDDYENFISTMSEYDWFCWDQGATLEGINWYNNFKTTENMDDWRMNSEYPTTPEEAFQSTGRRFFRPSYVQNARRTCTEPQFFGDIFGDAASGKKALDGLRIVETPNGELAVWDLPDTSINVANRYVIFVDIGGRSPGADYSVIKVFDRYWLLDGGIPEVVATWRGHLDQDLVAWKAAQLGRIYNNALVAVESNSLRKEQGDTEGDHFLTILDEIVDHYKNLYTRTTIDKVKEGAPVTYGFHTNRSTKTMILNSLNAALRDEEYIERDHRACDEMDTYEIKDDGTFGAVDGQKDDQVIVTAGGVWLAIHHMDPPRVIVTKVKPGKTEKPMSEATF